MNDQELMPDATQGRILLAIVNSIIRGGCRIGCGVSLVKKTGKFRAFIVNHQTMENVTVGDYEMEDDAVNAWADAWTSVILGLGEELDSEVASILIEAVNDVRCGCESEAFNHHMNHMMH